MVYQTIYMELEGNLMFLDTMLISAPHEGGPRFWDIYRYDDDESNENYGLSFLLCCRKRRN